MKNLAVAFASLSLLVIAALAVNQYLDEPAQSSASVANGVVPPSSQAASSPIGAQGDDAPSSLVPVASSLAPKEATRDMQQRYRAVDLGRPFFQWAMAHPEQGGAYYARKLAAHCRGAVYKRALLGEGNRAYIAGTDSQVYQRKIAAVEQLRRRCGDMSESELEDVLRQTASTDMQARDPLLGIMQIWGAQVSRDERARKAQALFLRQMDPLLADELGARLFRARQPNTIYFDGREWSLTETPVVAAALYLLPCELGLDCSAQKDMGLTMSCSSDAICYVSREDKALQDMLNGSQADLAEARALSRKMAAALRSGDAQRLSRGS